MKATWVCALCCAIGISLHTGCTKDKGVLADKAPGAAAQVDSTSNKITYSKNIKPLVSARCALSGCHVTNFPFGNFTQYADLKMRIDNGRVKLLVFDDTLMPPAGKVPLTTDELSILKAWIEDGAKQN